MANDSGIVLCDGAVTVLPALAIIYISTNFTTNISSIGLITYYSPGRDRPRYVHNLPDKLFHNERDKRNGEILSISAKYRKDIYITRSTERHFIKKLLQSYLTKVENQDSVLRYFLNCFTVHNFLYFFIFLF